MAKQTRHTVTSILSDLRNKKYFPVYFLMGDEPYYIDLISDYILENVLTEQEKEFNQTVFYGEDTDIRTIINTAKRFPMMADKQVIVVKEAKSLKKIDELLFYLQKPLDSTILVFCYKDGRLDMRRKISTEIAKKGILFESKKIRDYQVPDFIKSYLKTKQVMIEEKATRMLVDFLGESLTKIVNELDKLLITMPKNERVITPELIERNIGISKDYNSFELIDAIVKKDHLKAHRIVQYFKENTRNNPLPLTLSAFFYFFSNLMVYHYLPNKTQQAVASKLRVHPIQVNNYQEAARNYSAMKTFQIISLLKHYDAKGKGVDAPPSQKDELLSELVLKILN